MQDKPNNDQSYTFQPPQAPASGIPPSDDPAVDLARQQLNNAYGQPQAPGSAPYNPYRPSESSFSMPPANAPTQEPNPGAAEQTAPPAHQPPGGYPGQPALVHGEVEAPQRSVADIKRQLLEKVRGSNQKPASRFKPIVTAIVAGLVFLIVSYNEVALAQIRQYVSPSSTLATPVIIDPTAAVRVTNEPRIIIPKINVDVPVVYDIKTYDEDAIQRGLERGVVHYGETALPGQIGNNVIVGHSSNNFFNSGKYKFAFVLLDRLEKDDTFILHYKGTRYVYKVFNKEIIEPDDFSLIQPTDKPVVTLITCTPPGTAWHRLVVQAEQISPDIADAETVKTRVPTDAGQVPGNAPSLWSRFWDAF